MLGITPPLPRRHAARSSGPGWDEEPRSRPSRNPEESLFSAVPPRSGSGGNGDRRGGLHGSVRLAGPSLSSMFSICVTNTN